MKNETNVHYPPTTTIGHSNLSVTTGLIHCDSCNRIFPDACDGHKYNYCPYCGLEIEKEEKENEQDTDTTRS